MNCSGETLSATRTGGKPWLGPLLDLAANLFEHPVADGHDQAALLRDRDEAPGRESNPRRDDAGGAAPRVRQSTVDRELRLIVDLEAIFPQRVADTELDLIGLGSGGGNLVGDEEILIARRNVSPVHGGVGGDRQRACDIGAVTG